MKGTQSLSTVFATVSESKIILKLNVFYQGFPGGSDSKEPPVVQQTRVPSLGQEYPLEREWLPSPIFLAGEFHGQRSLIGYSPWGHRESDTIKQQAHKYKYIDNSAYDFRGFASP